MPQAMRPLSTPSQRSSMPASQAAARPPNVSTMIVVMIHPGRPLLQPAAMTARAAAHRALRDELAGPALTYLALGLTDRVEIDAGSIGDKAMRAHLPLLHRTCLTGLAQGDQARPERSPSRRSGIAWRPYVAREAPLQRGLLGWPLPARCDSIVSQAVQKPAGIAWQDQ